ncbi:MAG: hypothetical protein HY727_17940 [Candidatus Rokubacteria bacterium]|nr:hypothetical protein [Candidatus Rokubacteria bacterium]
MSRGAVLALAVLALAGGAAAAPHEDRILPLEQYTSEKGRALAHAHSRVLRELNSEIYHCLPWVEIEKESIGFFRPKHLQRDDRYLSLRIYIEQDPSPAFSRASLEARASAMFSRYVGPLLRRMARDAALLADGSVDGFTVVLEWQKDAQRQGERPIHETIAAFVDKPTAVDYLAGRLRPDELVARARVLGWDGETPRGTLRLQAWDDNFVATYKVKNYQLEPGVSCQ